MCMSRCVYVHLQVCVHVYVCVCAGVYAFAAVCVCMCVYVSAGVCSCLCVCICMEIWGQLWVSFLSNHSSYFFRQGLSLSCHCLWGLTRQACITTSGFWCGCRGTEPSISHLHGDCFTNRVSHLSSPPKSSLSSSLIPGKIEGFVCFSIGEV